MKPPEPAREESGELLDAVRETPPRRLLNSVKKIDALTEDEEKEFERGGKFAYRETKRRIVKWGFWIGFTLIALVIAAFAAGLIYIIYLYFTGIEEYHGVQGFVDGAITYMFGVASTIAAEVLWWKKLRSKSYVHLLHNTETF